MESVVGIFRDSRTAKNAAAALRGARLADDEINILTPADSDGSAEVEVETSETEGKGMGKALGGVVGGTLGATAGMGIGAAAATLLLPGVGAVAVAGLAAAALLGVGGAVGGAAAGGALEDKMSHGLPKDELYLYEDALRRGHSVVFALVEGGDHARQVRGILTAAGAESLDAARDDWWTGLRDLEAVEYERAGRHFAPDESIFRRGFEAALHPERRGRSFEEARRDLSARDSDVAGHPAFRSGYERGAEHVLRLSKSAGNAELAHRS